MRIMLIAAGALQILVLRRSVACVIASAAAAAAETATAMTAAVRSSASNGAFVATAGSQRRQIMRRHFASASSIFDGTKNVEVGSCVVARHGYPFTSFVGMTSSTSFYLSGLSNDRRRTKFSLRASLSTDAAVIQPDSDSSDNEEEEEENNETSLGISTKPKNEEYRTPASLKNDESSSRDNAVGFPSSNTELLTLPRHSSHEGVNNILSKTEQIIRGLYKHTIKIQDELEVTQIEREEEEGEKEDESEFTPLSPSQHKRQTPSPYYSTKYEHVYANSYVDLGKVDTIGFDYDYTLVTYTEELLELIYDMALKRLVHEKQYPQDMLMRGEMKFDPKFSIRGLAVDKETGWICHLSYTHKVAVAWEGRRKVPRPRLMDEYSGKRALRPSERRKRLKPLNDIFSMAECCLIADTVQYFKDNNIPFCPRQAVNDVLSAIGSTHVSGDFHRLVAKDPGRYFHPKPHLRQVLETYKKNGKRLIFVSNSPYWYVDAGMKYVIGPDWRDIWDVVIVSAGKPNFYTDDSRPFREVSQKTGRIKFKKVTRLEPGEVYTEGCLRELTKCLDWYHSPSDVAPDNNLQAQQTGGSSLTSPNVLYIGDSLFADLVDAKREFGWTTAAVTPEVGYEIEMQSQTQFVLAQQTIELLLNSLRLIQNELGIAPRTEEDLEILDSLERLVSKWRDEQTDLLGNPFGSVFRARFQPSLFAHSLRRYCDLYMSSVSSLRHYSPQHRFYPDDARLLSHEIRGGKPDCWNLEEILKEGAEEI